ncbi:MAG: GTP-binding protein, partial [Candidatus Odinarchaeota archaeon]
MYNYKIVCIGSAAVGKTTLIRNITNPAAASENYEPTLAVEVTDVELPELEITFRTWDFSGQEYLREIQMSHIKGADGAVLVFDLVRRDTLIDLTNWITRLLRTVGAVPMILVGNKVDLRETAVKDIMVTEEEGKELAKELSKQIGFQVPYIEVSATLKVNVNRIFIELSRFLGSPNLVNLASSMMSEKDDIDKEEALTRARDFLAEMVAVKTHTLIEEKEKFESIIELIPDGILVLEVDGSQYLANKALKDLYWQCFFEEMPVTSNWLKIPSDNSFISTIKQLFLEKELSLLTIEPKPGLYLEFSSAIVRFLEKPPFGIIIQVRDVTSFIEFDNMRKQVISSISHELRTPISVIFQSINNILKFKEKISPEKQDMLLSIIQKNAVVLAQLVEDLLIVSRIDEKRMKLEWIKYSL